MLMDESQRRSASVQLPLPIRVRGMSVERKFFDEPTSTILISQHGLMTRIKSLVELDTELHVVSLKNDVAGTFSVLWVDTVGREGFHHVGLQILQAESDMWGLDFPASPSAEDEATVEAWLECARCHEKLLGKIPLSELEYVGRGVLVARACVKCKATTSWEFAEDVETAAARAAAASSDVAPLPAGALLSAFEPVFEASPPPSAPASEGQRPKSANDRTRTRASLKLAIKIIRDIYGTKIEDVCDTIDVSRSGACFLTDHNYSVGETVQVILPYKEGSSMILPVLAKVVRKDRNKGSYFNPVAVQMEQTVYVPGLEDPTEPAPAPKKRVEQRDRSRVPLKFPIKLMRNFQGKKAEDFGETINISRTGACFQTTQSYSAGEVVQIVMPYKPGDVAIPVIARVVRQNAMQGSINNAVAIRIGDPGKPK
jgi:hypothetical protein